MEQFPGMSDENINISDVIEVIQTDPEFVESTRTLPPMQVNAGRPSPYVEILEQPASKALRFRYECEGRSAGSIPGVNSTPENKTFPSIRIAGYKGRALVVVSCVTKDPPHRPHPHNLVGKEACKRGVCTVEVSSENMTATFANLGIQCVKKKDIEDALTVREEMRVDPFRTGFKHKKQPTSIDLNAVRLCFQVFIEGSQKGKFNVALPAVVSDPIFDKKAISDLVISDLSHPNALVTGGMKIILLCEKVAKEDIQIQFFEEKDGQMVWEGFGDFQPSHVHKQTAITFKTPTYRGQTVDQPVQVYIQLKRPSDGATSEPFPFEMLPLDTDNPDELSRKRKRVDNSSSSLVLRHIEAEAEEHPEMLDQAPEPTGASGGSFPLYPLRTSPQHDPAMQRSPVLSQNMLHRSPVLSQGRPPLPVVYAPYHTNLMQRHLQFQYPSTSSHIEQPFAYAHDASQVQLQEQLIMDRVTPDYQGLELDAAGIVEGGDATSVLDMDNQQYSFESSLGQLNSAELAAIGTALAENLSSGLSISEAHKSETSKEANQGNNEESNSMTDSFTRITAELNTLNSMYKPRREVDD
ncbi:embryonic polarity protein dorsal-like isoform X2 [Lasioglossum baleicum]|uniref:embryonic polarity protein dorsal-like isoform X2 n=1 Tax=Lasioglossum baleicum TaxID=434251 RepID=UPI003FCCD8FD